MSDFPFSQKYYNNSMSGKYTSNDYRSMSMNSEHSAGQAAIANHNSQVESNVKADNSSSDDSEE